MHAFFALWPCGCVEYFRGRPKFSFAQNEAWRAAGVNSLLSDNRDHPHNPYPNEFLAIPRRKMAWTPGDLRTTCTHSGPLGR